MNKAQVSEQRWLAAFPSLPCTRLCNWAAFAAHNETHGAVLRVVDVSTNPLGSSQLQKVWVFPDGSWLKHG